MGEDASGWQLCGFARHGAVWCSSLAEDDTRAGFRYQYLYKGGGRESGMGAARRRSLAVTQSITVVRATSRPWTTDGSAAASAAGDHHSNASRSAPIPPLHTYVNVDTVCLVFVQGQITATTPTRLFACIAVSGRHHRPASTCDRHLQSLAPPRPRPHGYRYQARGTSTPSAEDIRRDRSFLDHTLQPAVVATFTLKPRTSGSVAHHAQAACPVEAWL
jgi:hypothetical protein